MRLYGWLWLLVAVPLGALGAVEAVLAVSPLGAWATGTVVAALSCLSHVCWVARDGSSRAGRRNAALAAGAGGLVGVTTAGLVALLGGGAAVLVVLVLGAHPRVLRASSRALHRLLHRAEVAPASGAAGGRTTPAPLRATRPAPRRRPDRVPDRRALAPEPPTPDTARARALTDAELCWAWRTSFTALDRADPIIEYRRWSALVAVRRCYLDELARRDPAGVARWLYAGARPASDPSRYLRGGPTARTRDGRAPA